jgi:hypothetical protein
MSPERFLARISANSTRPIADISAAARGLRSARLIPRRVAKKLRFSETLRSGYIEKFCDM